MSLKILSILILIVGHLFAQTGVIDKVVAVVDNEIILQKKILQKMRKTTISIGLLLMFFLNFLTIFNQK